MNYSIAAVQCTLEEAFERIGGPLSLKVDELMQFAAEDRIGGFNHDPNERRWGMGSLWEIEGKVLYALVRAMRPMNVLEIGCFKGCSSTHILEAMALNKKGKLTSIDIEPGAGADIPLSLRGRWKFVCARGQDYIRESAPQAEIVYEDGPHDLTGTTDILAAVRDVIKPALCISHDGAHFLVGEAIRGAHVAVFGQVESLLIPPSDCGFAWNTSV